ncbi:MAG: HRDC domain-containing protein [Candidatus Eisenbacteria bacterium]|nr:HRDC domain-containing protein [Candidatus Eisenbacteria bacterium]
MSVSVTILTLPFLPSAQGFDADPIEALERRCEILDVVPAFFEHGGRPYWTLAVTHRLRRAPGEQGAEGATEGEASPEEFRETRRRGRYGWREPVSEQDAGLYQALRAWRSEVADSLGVPVYLIFTNRQLAEIARLRPASIASLGSVPGVGRRRLEKHGQAVLDLVSRFGDPVSVAGAEHV